MNIRVTRIYFVFDDKKVSKNCSAADIFNVKQNVVADSSI